MSSSKSCCRSIVSLPKVSFSALRIDDLFYMKNLFREEQKRVKKRRKYAKATLSFALDNEPNGGVN
jgi:hypothetical protein